MQKKIRLLIVFWILMLWLTCFAARAIDWISTNQVVVNWNPAATLLNGDPIRPCDVISYEVFLAPAGGDKDLDGISVGETWHPEMVITLPEKGQFFIGVRTVEDRLDAPVSYSVVVWSNDPVACKDEVTFGVISSRSNSVPGDLEVKNNVD